MSLEFHKIYSKIESKQRDVSIHLIILLPYIIQFKMRRTADKGCRRELTVQQLSTYIHMHWLLPPRFSFPASQVIGSFGNSIFSNYGDLLWW